MAVFAQHAFAATGVHSLCWRRDELVDWVGGGRTFALDGAEQSAKVRYSYRFDAATASPDGRFVVIYERLGTKGLVLADGKVLREIDRSFYHAAAYEYPIALFTDPGGRPLLAHCPESYDRLDLEELETGRPLTASAGRDSPDFFHSRLAASPGGTRLSSAGWVWQPTNLVECFDVAGALADPHVLDQPIRVPCYSSNGSVVEEVDACWLDEERIVVSTADWENLDDPDEGGDEPCLFAQGIAVFDVARRQYLRSFQLAEYPGTILPIGRHHVLSLYRHPKLIDLTTGEVLHTWADLSWGLQNGSIVYGLKDDAKPPPMAFDPVGNRFAIAESDRITVIAFDLAALAADAVRGAVEPSGRAFDRRKHERHGRHIFMLPSASAASRTNCWRQSTSINPAAALSFMKASTSLR